MLLLMIAEAILPETHWTAVRETASSFHCGRFCTFLNFIVEDSVPSLISLWKILYLPRKQQNISFDTFNVSMVTHIKLSGIVKTLPGRAFSVHFLAACS